jgi:hypothetical protein
MKIASVITAFLLVISTAAAHADSMSNEDLKIVLADHAQQIRVALEMAPIKSNRQLHQYINTTPSEISAFNGISQQQQTTFIRSLKFNENGLTEFDPTPLKGMTPTQVYKILALFGMQSGTSSINAIAQNDLDRSVNESLLAGGSEAGIYLKAFLEGYRCEGRATCGESQRSACTSNC